MDAGAPFGGFFRVSVTRMPMGKWAEKPVWSTGLPIPPNGRAWDSGRDRRFRESAGSARTRIQLAGAGLAGHGRVDQELVELVGFVGEVAPPGSRAAARPEDGDGHSARWARLQARIR